MESGTGIDKFASAHGFPKFVKVGAEAEHELRKMGTRCERTKRHMNAQIRQDNGNNVFSKNISALFAEGGFRAIDYRAAMSILAECVHGASPDRGLSSAAGEKAASLLFQTASGVAECQRFLNATCRY